jgi:hypothetical protein
MNYVPTEVGPTIDHVHVLSFCDSNVAVMLRQESIALNTSFVGSANIWGSSVMSRSVVMYIDRSLVPRDCPCLAE